MDHSKEHRPGTDPRCFQCRTVAYEPGWYAALSALVVVDDREDVPVPV